MAAPDHSAVNGSLRDSLAAVLPKDHQFGVYHLSTPPTKTDALCSAPPNERLDRTYCENHFLAISINASPPQSDSKNGSDAPPKKEVLVLGVEIMLFTTAHATTLFVSKADSTGYLHMLNLPRGAPSPIREVCAAFIRHLVETRRRKDVQFVVSLFARSQDQYLFPGSIKHSGKHVLDDRGLVKWWCRVLDPLLEAPPSDSAAPWKNARGYLVIPGLDTYETRAFVPRSAAASKWSLTHPLERISHYCHEFDWVPPRCLIPRYPDDPKSRFRDELDEEASNSADMRTTGSWKSVKSLDMFWEMMAYRQECSSGRMTGFIWVVFDDEDKAASGGEKVLPTPEVSFNGVGLDGAPATPKKQRIIPNMTPNTTPRKLFTSKGEVAKESTKKLNPKKAKKKEKKKPTLRGKIIPRQPRIKTEQRNYLLDRPISTAYYHWPEQGRGDRIFSESSYKRTMELLLHLDFATLEKAAGSTRRWISEAGMGNHWGFEVTGKKAASSLPQTSAAPEGAQVNNIAGLIKRKRTDSSGGGTAVEAEQSKVNVLSAGMVRRKPKD